MPDKRRTTRLTNLVARLEHADDPMQRARIAAQLRDLAEEVVASSITAANVAGTTWRQIGVELGVPFQTLYRRYGEGS